MIKLIRRRCLFALAVLLVTVLAPVAIPAQDSTVVLAGAELTRVVPSSFYFEGQSDSGLHYVVITMK